jgi:hypothetical protein
MSHEITYSKTTKAIALPKHAAINSGVYRLFVGGTAMLLVALMTALPVKAQTYDSRDYHRQNNATVTVYEDCDYRGRSREISVGDYQNIRDLGLGNDSISSMRVANGLEIELFQDERFRRASTTINTNVSCLNRQWDDQASSLRVSYDDGRQYDDYSHEDSYQNRNENAGRNRGNANDSGRGRDFTKNVSRIEFANFTLVEGQHNRWNMSNRNGPNQSYIEADRDNRVIYLRNDRT